jgi:hypothetical protein
MRAFGRASSLVVLLALAHAAQVVAQTPSRLNESRYGMLREAVRGLMPGQATVAEAENQQ